jgi:hypothetical protein
MGRLLIEVLKRATRRSIREDAVLHIHRGENLKSYIVLFYGEATHRGSYKSHTALTSQKRPFFIVTAVKTSNLKRVDSY